MKNIKLYLIAYLLFASGFQLFAQTTFNVFDQILFYDGYATVSANPTPADVIRHRNDLYARKLTDSDLLNFGSTMRIDLTIKASCDNYDRIGNVNLALVPKGDLTYIPENVQRIEIARYITPFMDKNETPDEVPYSFVVDNLAKIFKDPTLIATYDMWIELQVFGVPYAANTEIAGCSGRDDVFFGTLNLISDTNTTVNANEVLVPLNFQNNLNNYQAAATDVVGQTVRTINFNLTSPVDNAKFYLITSNHGANSGGEEYNRRFHYIYLDGVQILSYRPGETTCEPYRIYNTQPNGIYSGSPRSNAQWQSFSNWCPGAKIPIREISLGNLSAGSHTFKIEVPSAVFSGGQGNFPVSLYLQGTAAPLGNNDFKSSVYTFYPNPTQDKLIISMSDSELPNAYTIYNNLGQIINSINIMSEKDLTISTSSLRNGIYFLKIEKDGNSITRKFIKN